MSDMSQFLSFPPILADLDEIRAALDTPKKVNSHYNPDKDLSPTAYKLKYRSAAVLIPILASQETNQLMVLVTKRALHMRNHPGQIAFPGGKHDPDDASIQYTALRETLEEIGLAPDCFDLMGELGEYCTVSGYCVKPIVAEITRLSEMSLCEDEVKSVHWIPLNYLLDPANYQLKSKQIGKVTRKYFEIQYQDIRIWGITADILFGLYQTLFNHIR